MKVFRIVTDRVEEEIKPIYLFSLRLHTHSHACTHARTHTHTRTHRQTGLIFLPLYKLANTKPQKDKGWVYRQTDQVNDMPDNIKLNTIPP